MLTHKKKNRLIAIIYSLSLGCIIFLLTSANLQINFISEEITVTDADISIKGHGSEIDHYKPKSKKVLRARDVDPVIRKYAD